MNQIIIQVICPDQINIIAKLTKILSNYDNCSEQQLIRYDHSRGKDELTQREIKDFTSERMPCLDFHANQLWYYMGILAFNLFQIFKRKLFFFYKLKINYIKIFLLYATAIP